MIDSARHFYLVFFMLKFVTNEITKADLMYKYI